jgi:hypothetical protein
LKKFIATTTISNDPENTCYIDFLENHKDWTLVIAGDEQTDDSMYYDLVKNKNAKYLSLGDQSDLSEDLNKALGIRTDCRKMFSILFSYSEGADVVALIDDDNYPLENWGKNLFVNEETSSYLITPENFVLDPLSVIKYDDKIWHRGYPLSMLKEREYLDIDPFTFTPLVQADLWKGEPDVDAISRMITTTNKFLDKDDSVEHKFFPFTTNKFSPFNSQNTFLSRSIIPYYFLFPSLKRMSDIWISYYLEALYNKPIVVYNEPTVRQKRNDHDISKDFSKEMLGYIKTEDLLKDLKIFPYYFSKYVTKKEWAGYLEYIKFCLEEE